MARVWYIYIVETIHGNTEFKKNRFRKMNAERQFIQLGIGSLSAFCNASYLTIMEHLATAN